MNTLLSTEQISAGYGLVPVLYGISLEVKEMEIVSLIGSNGAGKTTTINVISGLIRPNEGTIRYEGKTIDSVASFERVKLGIVQIPEGRILFSSLTVMENLEVGAYHRKARKRKKEALERVFQVFPLLKERRNQRAGSLSGGEQQMLAIGRGLMSLPRFLMFDEPSLGLAPLVVREIFRVVREINELGVTILLVEQNVKESLQASHRGYVLENGRIVLDGEAQELIQEEEVRKTYIGL